MGQGDLGGGGGNPPPCPMSMWSAVQLPLHRPLLGPTVYSLTPPPPPHTHTRLAQSAPWQRCQPGSRCGRRRGGGRLCGDEGSEADAFPDVG